MSNCGNLRSLLRGEGAEEKVICPKPQRVATMMTSSAEVLKPIRQWRSMPPAAFDGGEAGHEILEIFLSKNSSGETQNFGCSPPYFSGSPPCRAGNPVVRDAEFSRPRHPFSPDANSQAKIPTGPSFRASPSVRIEGFDCPGRGFECTGRDTRRRVPAFA